MSDDTGIVLIVVHWANLFTGLSYTAGPVLLVIVRMPPKSWLAYLFYHVCERPFVILSSAQLKLWPCGVSNSAN